MEKFDIVFQEDKKLGNLVNSRDLHEVLERKEHYTDWIKRMMEYNFVENVDFVIFNVGKNLKNDSQGVSEKFIPLSERKRVIVYGLTLDAAKEIAMIQRNEIGQQVRRYFIEIEKAYMQEKLQKLETYRGLNKMLKKQKEEAEKSLVMKEREIKAVRTRIKNIQEQEPARWEKYMEKTRLYRAVLTLAKRAEEDALVKLFLDTVNGDYNAEITAVSSASHPLEFRVRKGA